QHKVGPYDDQVLAALEGAKAEFLGSAARGDERLADVFVTMTDERLPQFVELANGHGLDSLGKGFYEIVEDGTLARVMERYGYRLGDGPPPEPFSSGVGTPEAVGKSVPERVGDPSGEAVGDGDWLDQMLPAVPVGEPLLARERSNGPDGSVVEAFRAGMDSFPELPDSVRDLPLVEALKELTDAQKVRLGVLMGEHGLADAPALLESGALETLLSAQEGTLRGLPSGEEPAGARPGVDEALAARVEALRDGERPMDVEGEYRSLAEGELEALLERAPGVPDGVGSEPGRVRAVQVEAEALRLGMSPEEARRYTERYEAAAAKGDMEAAEAIAGARDAHVGALERAYGELMQRLGPDAVAKARLDGSLTREIPTAADARDAGVDDVAWNSFEERIVRAVGDGRLADAQDLILARNELMESPANTTAGQDAVLAARLQALRDGDADTGGHRPVDAEVEGRALVDGDLEALLEQAPGVPEGVPLDVGPGDLRMVEALVTQARVAGVAEGEIRSWTERLSEAWSGRGRDGESLGEAGREWQQQLDQVKGRSPDPEVLLESPEATVLTQQETLARAAEEAGVSFEEHAGMMKEIRDAWAEGRPEDADTLVEQFWGRLEEATAQQQAERAAQAEQMMAQARGVTLEEYQAFQERHAARDADLLEVLDLLVNEDGPGLVDQVRQVLDGLGQDYADSPVPQMVREQLARYEDGTTASEEGLRQGLRDELLAPDAEGGAKERFKQALRELDGLVPVVESRDDVWAASLARSLAHHGGEGGMPPGEQSYWQDRYERAVQDGDTGAVIATVRDWNARYMNFERLEGLRTAADEALQDPVDREAFAQRAERALRQEDLGAFQEVARQWAVDITRAKSEADFQRTIEQTAGDLAGEADRAGMSRQEWDAFGGRIEEARAGNDFAEVLRIVDERAVRLEELRAARDVELAERLAALRDGGEGIGDRLEFLNEALAPQWTTRTQDGGETLSDESGLWELFEAKKPELLATRPADGDDPLNSLDSSPDTDPDTAAFDTGDVLRRMDRMGEDLFGQAQDMAMPREEIASWRERLESAPDHVAAREELRTRLDELRSEQRLDSLEQSSRLDQRRQLRDLGFTWEEINHHELGVKAAVERGDLERAAQLETAFDARVEQRATG
ncbi:hypothetical protein, partial [Streptomyces wedmorensis]|uniref:hypothetical protein n=1 Tax=Streptomyces wedmorensis TaxID=43759 RepID=UPI0005268CC0